MNGPASFGDEGRRAVGDIAVQRPLPGRPFERISGMSGTMTFLLGAGCLSGIIYWLTTRTENISTRRKSSTGDGYSGDYTSSGSGWNIANWFSSDNSSSNFSSDT